MASPTTKLKPKNTNKTLSRSKTSFSKKSRVNFAQSNSRLLAVCFTLVFGSLGTVILAFGNAATSQTSFSGSLSKKQPLRTHSISTTVSGTIAASAEVTKGTVPLTLKLKQGTTLIAQSTSTSTTAAIISAPVSSGTFTFEVSATTTSPAQYSLSVTYPVPDPTPVTDTTAPSAPTGLSASLTTTGTQVNLAWQSSTDNVGVTAYDVYRNSAVISTTMTTNYSDVNVSPSTTYTYTVKARDAANNISVASNSATVTTPTPADTTAPTISITSPINGATVSGTVNVTGSASDNVSLSRVDVQLDSAGFVPASGSSTWSYSLNTSLYADGNHTFTAKATDSSGNVKTAAISLSIQNSTGGTGTTTAPNTQGTWTSPEGAKFEITNTVCPITLAQLYQAIKNESVNAGDFAIVAPAVTVRVNDAYATMTTSGVTGSDGTYYNFSTNIWFNGKPDRSFCLGGTFTVSGSARIVAHEYGHAWDGYHLYMSQNGDWNKYLNYRWANADGTVKLGQDSRFGTSYTWDVAEIIADDYRLLYGSADAKNLNHLNSYIPDPRNQPGLKDWFDTVYKVKQ